MTALSIERTRELGTLRAIGLTKLELFYSLFLEIVIISVVNIVVGVILAYFAKLFIQFQKLALLLQAIQKHTTSTYFIMLVI